MNPDDQRDLEAVFGKDALKAVAKKASDAADRRVEGWTRRKGSALPDMRRGVKPTYSSYPAVPLNPLDSSSGGRGREILEPNQPLAARAKARDRFRKPVVEPVAKRKVRTKSGKPQNYQVAWTLEEHAERTAKLEAANAAALGAARLELEQAAAAAPLALPISAQPPAKLRAVDGEVRFFALQTTRRQRPKPTLPQIEVACECCGESPCVVVRDDIEQELDDRAAGTWDDYDEADHLAASDDVDAPAQWEIDHADEITEDIRLEAERVEAEQRRREEAERTALAALLPWIEWVETHPSYRAQEHAPWELPKAPAGVAGDHLARAVWVAEQQRVAHAARGISTPPDTPFRDDPIPSPADDACVHCGVDPVQTKKDGLCRNCKNFMKRNRGALPPPKAVNRRKRLRDGQR